ncbi:hypothetical protein JXR93_10540 [bacterium]|nr:hypothetical protein [bacterium]
MDKNNITFFKIGNYTNHNLVSFIKKNKNTDFTKMIDLISEEYEFSEVIPTLLNMITDDITQKEIIFYLDLLNYFFSFPIGDMRYFYLKMMEDKLLNKLKVLEKGDYRSIIYQFMIDYSPLYNFKISTLKTMFPLDQVMLLKKIVEIATKKSYLRFFLAYELLIFFSKNEINNLWLTIKSLQPKETMFISYLFHTFLTDKYKKELYKIISKMGESEIKSFFPYLKTLYPSKELYYRNLFPNTQFDKIQAQQRVRNGFLNRTELYFSAKNDTILLVSDFFEYTRYTSIFEFDTDFKLINSQMFRQPSLFSREDYIKHLKSSHPFSIEIGFDHALTILKGFFYDISVEDLPYTFILIHHFFFKGNFKGEKYINHNIQPLLLETSNSKNILYSYINKNSFHFFFDFDNFFDEQVYEMSKTQQSLYLKSPIFKEKLNNYIISEKERILKKLNFAIELSIIKAGAPETPHFLKQLYDTINSETLDYTNKLQYLEPFFKSYLSFNSKKTA